MTSDRSPASAARGAPSVTADQAAPDAAAIRSQLEHLLASAPFRNSKRCQALLRFVVEAYLEGALDKIKERTIGFEVFRRDAGYDTNQDSVVRTTAAEIRKRLAQYYLEPGREYEIRVALPQGSYVPEFRLPTAEPAAPPARLPVTLDETAPPVRRPRRLRWMGMAAAAASMLAVAAALLLHFRQTDLDYFWKPMIDDPADAVICMGQPLRVYVFDGPRTDDLNARMVGTGGAPPPPAEVRDATSIRLSELKPAGDRYFSFGDSIATVRISEWLGRKGKPFQVLGDRHTDYKDIRGRPVVLIGQFDNQWTVGLTGGLRYYLARNAQTYMYEVRDRLDGGKAVFSAPRDPNRPEEYAIVTRVVDPSTEKTVIAVAGMTHKGTIAGGEFLTKAVYMREAFRTAPPDWRRKNIQVVIKTAMVEGATGPPRAVKTYFW